MADHMADARQICSVFKPNVVTPSSPVHCFCHQGHHGVRLYGMWSSIVALPLLFKA